MPSLKPFLLCESSGFVGSTVNYCRQFRSEQKIGSVSPWQHLLACLTCVYECMHVCVNL